ncbi:hypothetical protein CR205_01625 [Alteribacter lacisalsi]|uniref:Uncharacterized protein n=1 Tax=Alteribacter lacisalsi TaxID=2045244 RepID=A0A2W0HKF1_9BACI|nr:hypothetical protein [Alteribacter lacisalsi]PYZ97329.1 hypothetical protein CR205_01625 [Alteribacter lacisalsi]
MSEYLFIAIGTVLLMPVMLLLPSVFSRKVTVALVLAAGGLTAGSFALLELYPWWVPLSALVLVLILVSAIAGAKFSRNSGVEDVEEVEKEGKETGSSDQTDAREKYRADPDGNTRSEQPGSDIVHKQPQKEEQEKEKQLFKRR